MFLFKICKLGEVHWCGHGGVVYADMDRANRDMAGIANGLKDSYCCFKGIPLRL